MKVLDLQPMSSRRGVWNARLTAHGRAQELFFEADGAIAPPEALDGLAMAALPVAMRNGFDLLRVHGPITHGALWRLLEYARIWHQWSPQSFHPTRIEPDRVLHGPSPDPAAPALVAWSGSMLSTHTLIRMLEQRAAGAPAVGGVVRLSGLRSGDQAGLDAAKRAIEAMGLCFHHVRTNACAAGLVDARQGTLPLVAAAMHGFSGKYSCGIHARGYPLAAQTVFPRPGPALPDLFCGDTFAVCADAGCIPLPLAAEALGRYPALAQAAQAARSRCTHTEQTLIRLAFRAAGAAGKGDHWRDLLDALLLPMGSGAVFCDARGICAHWSSSDQAVRRLLNARVRMGQFMTVLRDYSRWLLALAYLRRVYPR